MKVSRVKKRIIIIVPGRTDRAFYKSLLNKYCEYSCLETRDIRPAERNRLLGDFLPYGETNNMPNTGQDIVRKSAGIICNDTAILIIDAGGDDKVMKKLRTLLGLALQSELLDPGSLILIAVKDAEQLPPEEALKSLEDSFMSMIDKFHKQGTLKSNPFPAMYARGEYYVEFGSENTPGVILVVQGLKEVDLGKHAIEDFLIYIEKRMCRLGAPEKCCEELCCREDKMKGKKLVVLSAVARCGVTVEDLIYSYSIDDFLALIDVHDGLDRIVREIVSSHESCRGSPAG